MVYFQEDENGKKQTKIKKTIKLRRVAYQDEKNRYFEFLTNNFEITAEEVAFLYKKRWGIELLFNKMKQNFQLHLKIQIDFFEPVLIPAIRQKLFNRGQFGLTPVKNIFNPLSFRHKIPPDLYLLS